MSHCGPIRQGAGEYRSVPLNPAVCALITMWHRARSVRCHKKDTKEGEVIGLAQNNAFITPHYYLMVSVG